jgi:hypothetical protein
MIRHVCLAGTLAIIRQNKVMQVVQCNITHRETASMKT